MKIKLYKDIDYFDYGYSIEYPDALYAGGIAPRYLFNIPKKGKEIQYTRKSGMMYPYNEPGNSHIIEIPFEINENVEIINVIEYLLESPELLI